MKFGIIRNVTTDIVVVRVMSPRGLVDGHQHFGEKFRLCLPSEDRDIVFH
jgi:hypothetical protein